MSEPVDPLDIPGAISSFGSSVRTRPRVRLVDLDSVEVARLLKQLHLAVSAGWRSRCRLLAGGFRAVWTTITMTMMMMIHDERLVMMGRKSPRARAPYAADVERFRTDPDSSGARPRRVK